MHCRGLDHSKREWLLILFQTYVHLFGFYSRAFLLLLCRSAQIRKSNFFYHLVRQLEVCSKLLILFQYCYLGGEFNLCRVEGLLVLRNKLSLHSGPCSYAWWRSDNKKTASTLIIIIIYFLNLTSTGKQTNVTAVSRSGVELILFWSMSPKEKCNNALAKLVSLWILYQLLSHSVTELAVTEVTN